VINNIETYTAWFADFIGKQYNNFREGKLQEIDISGDPPFFRPPVKQVRAGSIHVSEFEAVEVVV